MVRNPAAPQPAPRELTGEEAAVYDRQIRLWGLEAQRRLATAKVLLVGDTSSLLSHELSKNIVLAGVHTLHICPLPSAKIPSPGGFLGRTNEDLVTALVDINPLVKVSLEQPAGPPDAATLAPYSLVCALHCTDSDEKDYAAVSRAATVPFYCGRVLGPVGYFLADLGAEYVFQGTRAAPSTSSSSSSPPSLDAISDRAHAGPQVERYPAHAAVCNAPWGAEPPRSDCGWHVACCARAFAARHGRNPGVEPDADAAELLRLYRVLCAERGPPARTNEKLVEAVGRTACWELPPVSAIVGGMWGREAIKVLSGREAPINNLFFFNAISGQGCVETVGEVRVE